MHLTEAEPGVIMKVINTWLGLGADQSRLSLAVGAVFKGSLLSQTLTSQLLDCRENMEKWPGDSSDDGHLQSQEQMVFVNCYKVLYSLTTAC